MLKQMIPRLWCIGFLLLSTLTAHAAWQTLAPGVLYQDLANTLLTPWSHVHVFRVDLNQNQLDLVSAKSIKKRQATVSEFAKATEAQIAINAGFFDEQFHPLGLRISQFKQTNHIKPISWWWIFQIKHNRPSIVQYSKFQHDHVSFAIQSGPRLLIRGKIPTLKPGHAERTALGITQKGELILLVTDRAPMTTTGLAKLMQRPPLSCTDALNLDGGSSSQLFAHGQESQIEARGFSEVSDAIIVKPNL